MSRYAPMVLKRNVTKEECPWLKKDLPVGTIVYPFGGETYGCLTSDGFPVLLDVDICEFWEVPRDALFTNRPKRKWTGRA